MNEQPTATQPANGSEAPDIRKILLELVASGKFKKGNGYMDWEKVGQEYPHYKAILSYPNSITSSPWMRGQQTMTRMATAGYLRRGPDGYEVVNPELRPLGNRKRRKPYTKRAPVSKPVEAEPANSGPSDIDAIRNEQTLQVAEELHFCPRCGNNLATYIHAMLVARQVR